MSAGSLARITLSALLLASGSAFAAAPETKACALLKDPQIRNLFPHAHDYLCLDVAPSCDGLDKDRCQATPNCFARSGSGSGVGCNPCTPDYRFQRCEAVSKEQLEKQILRVPACLKSGGSWVGACQCKGDRLFVNGRGCVTIPQLCSESGGTWLSEPPAGRERSDLVSEFLSLATCQARPMARWEPPPAPPVGLCRFKGLTEPWLCDQVQRKDFETRGVLESYQDQAKDLVLCTYRADRQRARMAPAYQFPSVNGREAISGGFCRKGGKSIPVTARED